MDSLRDSGMDSGEAEKNNSRCICGLHLGQRGRCGPRWSENSEISCHIPRMSRLKYYILATYCVFNFGVEIVDTFVC
jgi:hypothetical protein